jgi:hypothetical protein
VGAFLPSPTPRANTYLGGQAFEFARIAMEETREGRSHFEKKTRFHSANEEFNLVANLVYALQDALTGDLSEKQWETVDTYVVKSGSILQQGHSRSMLRQHREFWEGATFGTHLK